MIELTFDVCLLLIVLIGLYIAHRLDGSYPLWVRLICLAPTCASLFTLWLIIAGLYVVQLPAIIFVSSFLGVYLMVASRFSDSPWLDIRNKD